MRYLLLHILLLGYCTQAVAQKFKDSLFFAPRGCIDVQMGLAIPIMDYALTELTLASGYAKTGSSFRLGINYDIAPFIGFAAQYQYNTNPFNTQAFLTDIQTVQGGGINFKSYTSNPWELRGVLFGLYTPLKTYRTTFDFKLMGGVFTGVYPQNELKFEFVQATNQQTIHLKEFETTGNNIGFQVGCKMRYQLYKKLLFTASADFTYTDIRYTSIRGVVVNTNRSYSLDPYTQYYHIVNVLVGIGVGLN
jgi:hypothetical protein